MPLNSSDLSAEDESHMRREIEFLREENIVRTVSTTLPGPIDLVLSNGTEEVSVREKLEEGVDMIVPLVLPSTKEETTSDDEHKWTAYRQHGRNIKSKTEFGEEPVALYHALENIPDEQQDAASILGLSISNFALPPENMPWQDLLQFRCEDESQRLLRDFRLWLHKTASHESNLNVVVDELNHLIDEYKRFNLLHHKKYRFAKIAIAISAAPAVFTSLTAGGVAVAAGALEIARRRIALDESALSAPGQEVSYFIKAQDHIDRNAP